MKKNIVKYIMVGSVLMAACTDLEVKETDSIVVDAGKFQGVPMPSSLSTSYGDIRGLSGHENVYALQEATTDEIFIPTRGTDWGDNGVWRDLATHQWSASHLFNRNAWNELNSNVFRTNQILHPATLKSALEEAEAKFLRAFNMYQILDIWRQVPFREADEGADVNPVVLQAQEAIEFIEKDLTEALPILPAPVPGGNMNVANKAAAHFLLAKLYLNKHVYLEQAEAASADMDEVIEHVDAIEAFGFELEDDGYFDIFKGVKDGGGNLTGASGDSETIFSAPAGTGNRIFSGLHYTQGGWNGFATTAEFYSKFEGPDDGSNEPGDGQEERRGWVPDDGLGYGFLIGKQYGADGKALKARSGADLSFTKEVPTLTGNSDVTGIRVIKYAPENGAHFLFYRYADAFLMKAEAHLRKGDATTATNMVNELRDVRGASDLPGAVTEEELLDERGRELYTEGWRRSDMIRFGVYNTPFGYHTVTDETRSRMPIPDVAVASNPNLKQNQGY